VEQKQEFGEGLTHGEEGKESKESQESQESSEKASRRKTAAETLQKSKKEIVYQRKKPPPRTGCVASVARMSARYTGLRRSDRTRSGYDNPACRCAHTGYAAVQ
jgi:hypothetical protein